MPCRPALRHPYKAGAMLSRPARMPVLAQARRLTRKRPLPLMEPARLPWKTCVIRRAILLSLLAPLWLAAGPGAAQSPAAKAPQSPAAKAPQGQAPKAPAEAKAPADAANQTPPRELDPAGEPGGPGEAVVRSGLPVPRFVTLRSDEVNVRTGPGVRYPVEWVFVRKGMPVEITAEFDTWRRIRDIDGAQGWVHQSMLSGRRSLTVTGKMRTLRREASESAEAMAQVEPGVIGRIRKCHGAWCQVELQGYKGWLLRSEIWGVYPSEEVDD